MNATAQAPSSTSEARSYSIVKLDTQLGNFTATFERYRAGFFAVLRKGYAGAYHGDGYHLRRIIRGRAVIYLATTARDVVIGAAYIKRNRRRGGTSVDPRHRGQGVATALIQSSFAEFPEQYSIISVDNDGMINLLLKLGFVRATSVAEIRAVTRGEFRYLSDFRADNGYMLFCRHSETRRAERKLLTLFYRKRSVT
ncbi:MAG TPA: GNAT family N-acetyltransferase [Thermoanaerobaculia bacterium]|jgi:GNAT superfamily N-acetyltransferase|nr:GNAT family N-acetyltransferase [Thermoanaerobaculia bacterium]